MVLHKKCFTRFVLNELKEIPRVQLAYFAQSTAYRHIHKLPHLLARGHIHVWAQRYATSLATDTMPCTVAHNTVMNKIVHALHIVTQNDVTYVKTKVKSCFVFVRKRGDENEKKSKICDPGKSFLAEQKYGILTLLRPDTCPPNQPRLYG